VDPVPPPQVRPGERGFLALKSTPAADIEIDGKSIGLKTPQDQIELRPGVHTIRLSADGLEETFQVEISSDNTLSLERTLTRKPNGP
jgi:hypothetical protein